MQTVTLKRLAAACLFVATAAPAQAPFDVRVALVIGNSAYAEVPRLDNARNDARAVSAALRGLGFTVEEIKKINTLALGNIYFIFEYYRPILYKFILCGYYPVITRERFICNVCSTY
ncbi:MAG: caspase family protein, partial [Pseudomonadota bacterium]